MVTSMTWMNEQLKDYNHTLNNEPWTMLRFWQRKLQKLIQVYVCSLAFTAFIYISIHISYNGFSVDWNVIQIKCLEGRNEIYVYSFSCNLQQK